MPLLDTRFAGMAKGVGTSKILGRVHLAELEIGGVILQCSFTVLENNDVDLLFGLDNLKRHQCCIDLVSSQLHVRNGEISVPFLGDGEIKQKEPSSAGLPKNFDKAIIAEIKSITGVATDEEVIEALAVCDGVKENAINFIMNQKN